MSSDLSTTERGVRAIVVEDEPLFRDLLKRACDSSEGISLWKDFASGEEAVAALEETASDRPRIDVAVVDIQLAGGMNGLQTALRLRRIEPGIGIVLLSHHRVPAYLSALESFDNRGFSYLLKDTVVDFDTLERALLETANGGVVVDPSLLSGAEESAELPTTLTERQKEILHLVAQGYSNQAIAGKLFLSHRTVENHLSRIYVELGIENDPDVQPRVQAVVRYLTVLFPMYLSRKDWAQ